MSVRREGRTLAVQFLFQRDFNAGELDAALEQFWADQRPSTKVREFAESLIRGVEGERAELDRQLQGFADHWDIERMGGVDRNVMRVSLFEMLHRPDIPPVVSINEAVELAKELSSDESGRFVNGILDRALRDVQRAARTSDASQKPPAASAS